MNAIALVGCGNVGTALLELLHEKRSMLGKRYGFKYKVTLVTDLMKGTVMDTNGLDLEEVLGALHNERSFSKLPQSVTGAFPDLLDDSEATMLAEATPTDLKTGEPGLTHIRTALSRGISVTTSNKGPISIAYDELHKLGRECGAKLGYEGVVMSGTPLIQMVRNGMAGCDVMKIEGILNGTTNFILTKMHSGATYAEALEEATSLGYAEADPSGDVEGFDAAVKVSILAKILFDKNIPVSDVDRAGITHVTPEKINDAKNNGYVVKLIAGIEKGAFGVHAYVKPKEIPSSHPLASICGATNAVTVTTDNLGEVTLIGPGAGRRETGQALLSDLISMAR